MRRHHFFILLLSLIIPLQAVAGALLNAPCLDSGVMEQTEMQMKENAATDNTMAMENMPCCPDKVAKQSPSCKSLNSCHLCKTPGQIELFEPLSLMANLSLANATMAPVAMLSVFNPASIWRPPSTT